MKITIIAFGNLAEITGEEFDADAADTDGLMADLINKFPTLAGRKILLAVNQRVVKQNVTLAINDIVAIMPPYSGG